jgi:penicillin amidase
MAVLIIVFVALCVLVALVAAGLVLYVRRPLPRIHGTLRLAGLKGQVEVIRDRWGVPHIYADSAEDLFFAQGYIHAQDRMWQMELQRRIASGRLSEIFGEDLLDVDRLFRILGLRRAAAADEAALSDESRSVLEAYAAGVNAFLEARSGRWSVEFNLLRLKPEPWQSVDSLCWLKVMAWNMGCNWETEWIRARLADRLGPDLAADLEPPYPADNPPIVQGPGLPADAEPPPNGWGSEALRQALRQVEGLLGAAPGRPNLPTPPPGVNSSAGGSNQWVVSGARSASGLPLLANDTHLPVQLPSAWYLNHLDGAGYQVTGVSLPGLPVFAVGHNAHCAWGITIAWQDAQDLYVEKLNPGNPHQVEYQGQWLDAEVVREEIRVKGREEPVVQEVLITRHGPIISPIVGEDAPLALRWVALEPSDPLRSALGLMRTRDWEAFRQALSDWAAPSLNFVYADTEGNIGFLQAGRVPIRPQGHGLVPVPGWTGEHEWQGYLSVDELPQAYNPESGWLATSNHLVVDSEFPHYVSSDLENPCRVRRAVDLLTAQGTLSAGDCARFQLDTYSAQAERFARHLLAVEPQTERERQALDHLRTWDAGLEPDNVAASLYQLCRLRALHLVFDGHLGDLSDAYVGLGQTALGQISRYHGRSIVRLLDLLDGPGDDGWLRDPASGRQRTRQELLHQALRETLALLEAELGPDMSRWTWGRLNRVHFAHPLGSVKPLHLLFNRGPYPMGGDQDTLLRASGTPRFPFEPADVVDALRFVADLGDWERCQAIIPGGQSGHVASRHYADLIPPWREGRLQPMPFARRAVEQHAAAKLRLLPP